MWRTAASHKHMYLQRDFCSISLPQMPMCLIVGCSRKSGRDKEISLYRVPPVVTNQGPEVEELSLD